LGFVLCETPLAAQDFGRYRAFELGSDVMAVSEKSVTSEHRNVDDAYTLTGIAFLFEVVAGIIAHSLALLSDAGHMQTMMSHAISLSNEGGG
jgi:Co/Zn/Cd efflux system component